MLGRNRTVTAVAILTLALGVGLNTAIFSVLESIVLRQLPFPAADRLVTISREDGAGRMTIDTDIWTVQEWREHGRSIDSIALYGDAQFTFLDRGNAEVWRGMRVTAAFFDTLGVAPLIGRTFAPDEDRAPLPERSVVLGNDLWRRRFGADAAIVGRVLELNGSPARVIGVMPADFHPIRMSNPAEVPQLFTGGVPIAEYMAGAALAAVAAYLSARFLLRYFRSGRLDPYGFYCIAAGVAAFALLTFGA